MDIKITIKHDLHQIRVVGKTVRHLCVIAGFADHPSMKKVELAVVELLTNIVGYSVVKSADALIELHCQFEDEKFSISVSDNGQALSAELVREYSNDTVSMPSIDLGIDNLPECGWGIQLIKSACDEVGYRRVKEKNVYDFFFDFSCETV